MPSPFSNDVEFQKLLDGRPEVNLVGLMLEFAADEYPDIDREACAAEVERLGEAARLMVDELPPGATLERRLAAVSRVLFRISGFSGNTDSFYEPANSYLNTILERRRGIPITLSLLYMSVAARAGIKTYGVAAPAHFLVGCKAGGKTWYVDAFNGGQVLSRAAAEERIRAMLDDDQVLRRQHFRPATPLEMAKRMLRNLKTSYIMQDEWAKALPVQMRLSMLLPDRPDEQRDLGLVYLRLFRPQPALRLLEAYREGCGSQEAAALEPFIRSAYRMQAEMN